MSPFVTYALVGCLSLLVAALVVEWARTRALRPFLVQLALVAAAVLILNLTTGFPVSRQAFGGASPLVTIAIMFVASLLGIAARYVYFMRTFSWPSLLKPMCLTPIVLLPLVGSVQTSAALEPVQVVSLSILAFQNGFFWKAVLEHAEAKLPK